jgi:hypothetical protein
MTTRLKGFTVALEQDIREDDAENIKNAIESLRFVQAVKPIEASSEDWINRARIKNEFFKKLYEALNDDPDQLPY